MNRMIFAALWLLLVSAIGAGAQQLDERGLHVQPWIDSGSMNLGTDLARAAAQGRHLMILYEQRGCIYCAQLHEVNFARTEITDLIRAHFKVIQLDLNGTRMMTDFDGTRLSEADLARKWGVGTTPTTLVLAASNAGARDLAAAETFRLPGYLEPFYYFTVLDYFASGAFGDQDFQTFVHQRIAALAEEGKTPEDW